MEHVNDIRKSGIDPGDIDADQYTSVTPHVNKPLALRTRLGLTQKKAGMLILCNPDPDDAQSVWQKIERENRECDDMSNMCAAIFWHVQWLIDNGEIHVLRRMYGL